MTTLVCISNGYGEDLIGAQLIKVVQRDYPEVSCRAFPIVDAGGAYQPLALPILGPRQLMPSGGLLLHHPALFWRDIRAGFVPMTVKQLQLLRTLEADGVVVVGDVYALLLSLLVRCRWHAYVQTLVSVRHQTVAPSRPNRIFMENITPLERRLMRRLTQRVYCRDEETAQYLRGHHVSHACYLGSPILDTLDMTPPLAAPSSHKVVALLPGTRPYAYISLQHMLRGLACLPEVPLIAAVAWARPEMPDMEMANWLKDEGAGLDHQGVFGIYRHAGNGVRVLMYRGRFAAIIRRADWALGTAGTAHEQVAALGKPLVTFPVPPFYTKGFLRNQKQLLGDALSVCAPSSQAIATSLLALEHIKLAHQVRHPFPSEASRAIVDDLFSHVAY